MKKLFTLILITIGIAAYSQPYPDIEIEAEHITAPNGTLAEVDIIVTSSNWDGLTSSSGSISWDPEIIEYSSISYFATLGSTEFNMSNINTSGASGGVLTWNWTNMITVGGNLGENDVIFTIEFSIVGASGEVSDVDFSNSPTSLAWYNTFGWSGTYGTTSGSVTVGGLNLTGCYDPDNWTTTADNTNGGVIHSGGVITMTGDNDQIGNGSVGIDCDATQGNVSHCVTIPNAGIVTFNWDYDVAPIDSADVDAFGYCLNGVATQLASPMPAPFGTPNGSASVEVTANSELCFVISSENSWLANAPVVTISEFIGPPCEYASLTAEIVQTDLVGCVGEANASLEVMTEFGTEPFTYDWDQDGVEGANPTGLSAGTYCVTVIDAIPDTSYICYEIIEGESVMSANAMSNPDDGTGTGMVLVNVSGGTPPYTITWDTDPVQTGPIVQGLDYGVYTYTVVDQWACTIIDQIEVIWVGIEEITGLQNFEFYPNPTDGIINLNIEFDRNNEFAIYLLDAVGRKVVDLGSSSGSQFQNTIDLSSLPAGFYYLNLEVDGFKTTKKVIVK